MITLGIDPGTARLGFGVVDDDPEPTPLAFGVLETSSDRPMAERLLTLFDALTGLLAEHRPDVVAVEQLFFARNVTTAIVVGQARGVVLLAAARAGVPVVEYSPSEVKHAVVGYGKADKPQMQEMVRLALGLATVPHPDDAADALAVALCHGQTAPFLARTAGG
ncbi:MAG: RuvC [uncultured Thermomicrobiales bacterium]|uniref:Crossover junction endodeoxyribonuclease RuvC n=1 Tax=uncultured Thermomicrobiales bacterium TaxID=1645740 RepID=A0A6J4UDC4_9BACT|nr:MAG: RuvC [uncultured Thermomicrobiales bacterium]